MFIRHYVMNLSNELRVAMQIARGAWELLLKWYAADQNVTIKENDTPVGDADFAANDYIIRYLTESFSYPILSEESADDLRRVQAEKIWIVDPLDGTEDFISQTWQFTVAIALLDNGKPIAWVVYRPTTWEIYYAERGQWAFLEVRGETKKLFVSKTSSIPEGKFVTGKLNDAYASYLDQKKIINRTRLWSAALTICKVAQGEYDGYFKLKTRMSEWDDCAAGLILSEAGGKLSDAMGQPLLYNQENVTRTQGLVATNWSLHAEMISIICEFTRLS